MSVFVYPTPSPPKKVSTTNVFVSFLFSYHCIFYRHLFDSNHVCVFVNSCLKMKKCWALRRRPEKRTASPTEIWKTVQPELGTINDSPCFRDNFREVPLSLVQLGIK